MSNEKKITVLVVDDSDIIRNSLRNFFQDYNFEVITCHDGLEGIQKTKEYRPSLIFLDLMMPNFDGVKMLQVIKVLDELKNIPVIVISANTNRSNVLAAIEAGAERVISKPLQKDVIIKHVNEILGSEFLSKAKKGKLFTDNENKVIMQQLAKFFLNGFPVKKKFMQDAVASENKDLLKHVVHELRGEGGSVGYMELSKVAGGLEDHLGGSSIDWDFIKTGCEKIFSIVDQISIENSSVEK